jgi:hypothetical protein
MSVMNLIKHPIKQHWNVSLKTTSGRGYWLRLASLARSTRRWCRHFSPVLCAAGCWDISAGIQLAASGMTAVSCSYKLMQCGKKVLTCSRTSLRGWWQTQFQPEPIEPAYCEQLTWLCGRAFGTSVNWGRTIILLLVAEEEKVLQDMVDTLWNWKMLWNAEKAKAMKI